MPWRLVLSTLLLALPFGLGARCVYAQADPGPPADVRTTTPVPESEIAKIEQELAGRVVEFRKSQEAEDRQREAVESLTTQWTTAKEAGNAAAIAAAKTALRDAERLLSRLAEQTATAQKLHTQLVRKAG